MPSILYAPEIQIIDAVGQPLVGGKIYTYFNGTSTPQATWADYNKTVLNTNPVILDPAGRAPIIIDGNYKIVITDQNDVPVYTMDDVHSLDDFDFTGLTASVEDLNSTKTTSTIFSADLPITIGYRGQTILADCTSVSLTMSLPPVATVPDTFKIVIKKIDVTTNYVTIQASTTELIEEVSKLYLYDYGDVVELQNDGSGWRIVNAYIRGTVRNISAATYTVDFTDFDTTLVADTTSNSINIALPSAVSIGRGFKFTTKAVIPGSNSVTITASGTDLIDGNTSILISGNGEAVGLKCTGVTGPNTSWIVSSGSQNVGDYTTGDTKTSFNIAQNGNWLLMNDTWDIGKQGSGAHYAQDSAHNLFLFLYNAYSNTICPVSGGRTGNAENDWQASKKLTLPLTASRVIGVAGSGTGLTTRTPAELVGGETHIQAANEVGVHTHPMSGAFNRQSGTDPVHNTTYAIGGPTDTNGNTGGTAMTLMQPTVFEYHFIHL